jgi:AhpD family alkylhydroperoxidase
MPRLRYIEEGEKTSHTRELIESAKRTGAPDPRVVSLMTRSPLGIAWVEYWNKLLYQGALPHKLKEMCRIKISVAHQCGYCSTVRSNVAKAEGLTEDMISDLFDYSGSTRFSARELSDLTNLPTPSTSAQNMDFNPGDVGYVKRSNGHYIKNVGDTDLQFLEIFRSSYFADVSLSDWLTHTPPELVAQHLNVDEATIAKFPNNKPEIMPE